MWNNEQSREVIDGMFGNGKREWGANEKTKRNR